MALISQDSDDGRASEGATEAAHEAALRRELAGYQAAGKTYRAAQVKAELKRYGFRVDADKPAKAEKAEAEKPAETKQATA